MTIQDFFLAYPRAALAFSGGVDSAWLLYAGLRCGAELRPYYVKTAFQPEFEYADALRLCGLTKPEIRRLSREAGLFTWCKPAYACLATRIRTGEPITAEKLRAVEESEDYLFSLGFSDFRVRCADNKALLQFPAEQLEAARAREREIRQRLSPLFAEIRIDPQGRKTGL